MSKPIYEMSSWRPSDQAPQTPPDDWAATRQQASPPTQLMRDQEDYLGDSRHDVGRKVSDHGWELFVVCEAAEAMRQQFEHLHPEFIAVHDIAATASLRLLGGLATATGKPLQQLVIRRQGYGVALATLEFVELTPQGGQPVVRVYSTQIDADAQCRHALADVLMAHSRLAVAMVGELPAHAIESALQPLHDSIAASRAWPNRHLLVLPLGSASALAQASAALAAGTGMSVRTTPQVTRPSDAWNFIQGAWEHLARQAPGGGTSLPALDAAVAASPPAKPASATRPAPLPLQPMPALPGAKAQADPPSASPISHYVQRCGEIKGMVSCSVFELASQRTLAHAGARPGPAALASQGALLFSALTDAGKTLGLGHAPPEASVTLATHHLLLRAVPRHPGLVLHAVLDSSATDPARARAELVGLDALLVPKPA